MRLISQNRAYSVNFNQICIGTDCSEIYAHLSDGKTKLLGRYTSIERSEGIFHEIHRAYLEHMEIYYMPKV